MTSAGSAIYRGYHTGLFPAILGKDPWPKLGKMIDLTSKLGENNDIEHKKGSKIYPLDQVILDCIKSSIQLKHSWLSIILRERERALCIWFAFCFSDVLLLCSVSIPHGAVGWSAVCNCGIS